MHWSVSEALFKCVVENDLAGLRTYIEAGEDVNAQNEEVVYDTTAFDEQISYAKVNFSSLLLCCAK